MAEDRRRGSSTRRRDGEDLQEWASRVGNRTMEIAETVIYIGIAAILVITALALLASAAEDLLRLVFEERDQAPAIEVLDTLLLIFIVVELLYAVRATITKWELVAEPFLLVGILASIKEIVVLSVKAAEDTGKEPDFINQMIEIGILGVLVVLLGFTVWLLRLKEREPEESGEEMPDADGAAAERS